MVSVSCFGVRVSVMFHFMFVHYTFILSTKRNAMFLFAIFGVKIIDFKHCFNSVVLPSNKDLDCIVSL